MFCHDYVIKDGRLCERVSGEPIPDDEPVFILRGRDPIALEALEAYFIKQDIPSYKSKVASLIKHFAVFQDTHRRKP
jgi:hypothetical protein